MILNLPTWLSLLVSTCFSKNKRICIIWNGHSSYELYTLKTHFRIDRSFTVKKSLFIILFMNNDNYKTLLVYKHIFSILIIFIYQQAARLTKMIVYKRVRYASTLYKYCIIVNILYYSSSVYLIKLQRYKRSCYTFMRNI